MGERSRMLWQGVVFVVATTLGLTTAYPKYETDNGVQQNLLENVTRTIGDETQDRNQDQVPEEDRTRPPRFGFPVYTQDVQDTANALPGVYSPVRLDIGGLVLGTMLGLGAFFILPKIFQVVATPGYAGYKRSEDEEDAGANALADVIARLQESLNAYEIDSSSCVQRAICYSVQAAGEKVGNHTANSFESVVDGLARNDVVKHLLEGTEWRKTVEIAERGENCDSIFYKCPDEIVTVISAISKYLLS